MASMLTHSTVQPQVVAALSQLTSLLNGVRTLHTSVRVPHHQKEQSLNQARTTSSQAVNDAQIFQQSEGHKVSCELDLTDLADVDRSVLSPLLTLIQKSSQSGWEESHVSAQSFFENKTGFAEGCLKSDMPALTQIMGTTGFQNFLRRGQFAPLLQQQRGFKTRRSESISGLGKDKDASFIDELRHSVFTKVFPEKNVKKEFPKFQKIVTQHDSNPEFQDKLKVAFAEGYHANATPGEAKTTLVNRMFRFFVYMCILWLAVQLVLLFTSIGGGTGVRGLGVLSREQFEVNPEEINISFDDVKGVAEAKQELKDIVEFLKDPDKFTALGAKLPKGVLLVGPPGIGKTLLARAVAGEAGVPFFHASGSEFDEIFVGTGAKRVRQMFSAAKVRAPCVIFIDEIDSVGAKRTSSQIHPYANQTINQLLSEMDGFNQNEGVIVLGATNRRDNLDKALLRPGRFDVEVRVFPPDMKGRQEILEYYLSKVKKDSDIDTEKLARGTTGFTGADIENMVNQAALKAAMDEALLVSMIHMEFARDKVIMGPAKKTKIPDQETNLLTAYHEAGHTLVAYFTKDATPLHKVTIVPRGMSLGHTSFIDEKEVFNRTRSQLLAQMDVAMGGRAAEEIVYGMEKVTTGASSDFQTATSIAMSMVKLFGMSEKVGIRVFGDDAVDSGLSMVKVNEVSPAIQEQVDSEVKRILQESYDRAKQILRSHQSEHKALAQALMKYETLDKDDIKAIIEGKKIKSVSKSL